MLATYCLLESSISIFSSHYCIFCIIPAITAPAVMIPLGQSYTLCACQYQTIKHFTILDMDVRNWGRGKPRVNKGRACKASFLSRRPLWTTLWVKLLFSKAV